MTDSTQTALLVGHSPHFGRAPKVPLSAGRSYWRHEVRTSMLVGTIRKDQSMRRAGSQLAPEPTQLLTLLLSGTSGLRLWDRVRLQLKINSHAVGLYP